MTPLDELQAAHKRLSDLKAITTGGPWLAVAGQTGWDIDSSVSGEACADYMTEQDAALVVTLHRTIDAQLAMLVEAMKDYEGVFVGDCPYPPNAIILARAINGEK